MPSSSLPRPHLHAEIYLLSIIRHYWIQESSRCIAPLTSLALFQNDASCFQWPNMDLKRSTNFTWGQVYPVLPCCYGNRYVSHSIYGKMYSPKVMFFHSHLHNHTKPPDYNENSDSMLLVELSSSYRSCIHLLCV